MTLLNKCSVAMRSMAKCVALAANSNASEMASQVSSLTLEAAFSKTTFGGSLDKEPERDGRSRLASPHRAIAGSASDAKSMGKRRPPERGRDGRRRGAGH